MAALKIKDNGLIQVKQSLPEVFTMIRDSQPYMLVEVSDTFDRDKYEEWLVMKNSIQYIRP